jgi:hypothetical protein
MKTFRGLIVAVICLAVAGAAPGGAPDPANDMDLLILPDDPTIEVGEEVTLEATWSGAQSLGYAQWFVDDVPQGSPFNPANDGSDEFVFTGPEVSVDTDYVIRFCMWHVTQTNRTNCYSVTVTVKAPCEPPEPPEPPECEWIGETAWAAGCRYVTKGNWATYTSYSGVAKTVTLFAGQTMEAGTVYFSAPSGGNVTITIVLNAGWRFADVDENVKIQDYASPPAAVNPAPGLFAWKGYATVSPFDIVVPENNFYGVHVNVEWACCP